MNENGYRKQLTLSTFQNAISFFVQTSLRLFSVSVDESDSETPVTYNTVPGHEELPSVWEKEVLKHTLDYGLYAYVVIFLTVLKPRSFSRNSLSNYLWQIKYVKQFQVMTQFCPPLDGGIKFRCLEDPRRSLRFTNITWCLNLQSP